MMSRLLQERRAPWTRAQLLWVLWLVFVVALGLSPRPGADYPRYLEWLNAITSSNMLEIESEVVSPVGIPVTQWAHAPALIAVALNHLLAFVPFVQTGLPTVAWLAALLFWWSLIGLLRIVTGGNSALVLLALAAAFIGTLVGFYSRYQSSEIFALASFTTGTYWAVTASRRRLVDSALVGIASGLLLICRLNLLMYVLLPLAIQTFGVWRAHATRPSRLLLHALALGLPVALLGVQLLAFNYWMTGSPLRSPYVYGNEQFRSVDFAHPLLGATLLHAWHGLLTYHPLFALGAPALLALALGKGRPLPERLLCIGGLLVALAHVYMAASWWCWWNGTGTFGNRNLTLASVILILALARWLSLLLDENASRWRVRGGLLLLGLVAAACAWSFLFFIQVYTNYHDWTELLRGQGRTFREQGGAFMLAFAAVPSLLVGLLARRLGRRAALLAVMAFVVCLSAAALFGDVTRDSSLKHDDPRFTALLLYGVTLLALVVSVYVAWDREGLPAPGRLARRAAAGALVWILVAGSWDFAKLTLKTKELIASPPSEQRSYAYRSTMVISEIVASVHEYGAVKGFSDRKRAAKRFIEGVVAQASLDDSPKRQPPRHRGRARGD